MRYSHREINNVKEKIPTRLWFLIFFILFFYLIIFIRVLYISVIGGEDYVKKVLSTFPKGSVVTLTTYRGSMLDKNGQPLAISIPTISVYAFPKIVKNKEELSKKLSKILNINENKVLSTLNSKDRFVWIARQIDPSLKGLIENAIYDTKNTSSVGIEDDFKRYYPHGNLASNVIGFTGFDGKGLDGLEFTLNKYLGGKPVKLLMLRTPDQGKMMLKPISLKDTSAQDDVYLTIDLGVQSIIEELKKDIVQKWHPQKVAIVVMNVRNGDILGITTYPDFDPNDYQNYPSRDWQDVAVTDVFEPGSTMKPFFIGYALKKRYINTNYVCNANGGTATFYGVTVSDVERNGILPLDQVIIKSSNVCAMKIASNLTKQDALNVVRIFHLIKPYNVLPGESWGKIPNFDYPINRMFSAIGQGIAVNTLNLTAAYASLATDNLVKPRIIKKIVNPLGKVVYESKPEILEQNIYPNIISFLHKAMEGVVEEGTATAAKSTHFTIAGKTGTSQIFDFRTGKYHQNKVVAVFAGFFPVSNPRFAAVIMAYNPQPGYMAFGGNVSAPEFRKLVDRMAFYYGLRPDK